MGEPHLRLHAVNIYVHDQERSLRFYLDQLGFRLALDVRLQNGRRWVAVAPPDGSAILSLIAPEPGSEQAKLIGRPTQVVFLTEDVIAKFREWSGRGVRFRRAPRLKRIKYATRPAEPMLLGEETPVWGEVYSRFEDVDGNSFALIGFDEVSRKLEAERRAIAEKLEAERRTAQELEIARQVQARLFPQGRPPLAALDYAGLCLQARQVGGDYYDFLDLGGGRLGLVIGDIAGKGIAAALLMANLQANLRSQCALAWNDPRGFLRSVNRLFCDNTAEGAYATLFFAAYDDASGRFQYANCGHVSALLIRGDGCVERLASTCTVLGLFRDWECGIEQDRLGPGDTLILYTDGITESFNDREEDFGEPRLVETLCRNRGLAPRSLIEAVLDAVKRFSPDEQHDDITLIVARRLDRSVAVSAQ